MNANDLDKLLASLPDSVPTCISHYSGRREAERKQLASSATEALAALLEEARIHRSHYGFYAFKGETLTSLMLPPQKFSADDEQTLNQFEKRLEVCKLAALATCSFAQLTQFDLNGLPSTPEHAYTILVDRNPNWLDKWLSFAGQCLVPLYWPVLRRFEKEGLAKVSHNSSYFVGLVLSAAERRGTEFFRADAHLLAEQIWELLADDIAMVRILAWKDVDPSKESLSRTLITTLVMLVKEGSIDLNKLRELGFQSLYRLSDDRASKTLQKEAMVRLEKDQSLVSWWTTLIDSLPSDQRPGSFEVEYLRLLSTRNHETLSWALAKLSECGVPDLHLRDFYTNVGNVFFVKHKLPSLQAIILLRTIVRAQPTELEAIASVVVAALEHPSSEVQEKGLDLLEESGAYKLQSIANAMNFRVSALKGILKKRADGLLILSEQAPPRSQETRLDGHTVVNLDAHVDVDVLETDILSRIRQLNPALVEAAQVRETLRALQNGALDTDNNFYKGLRLDSRMIPRLNPERALQAVSDLDELIYLSIQVLQSKPNPDNVERTLDGVSRLCHLRPRDFASTTSALRKEIRKVINLENEFAFSQYSPFAGIFQNVDIAALLDAWLEGEIRAPGLYGQTPADAQITIARFFSARLEKLALRAAEKRPAPLLAAPTHAGGWIDPRVLGGRLRTWEESGAQPDLPDQVQCLLRLAPDFRSEAIQSLSFSASEFARACRFALGGDLCEPAVQPELWIAALRSRDPVASSAVLMKKFGVLGPDAIEPATYLENIEAFKQEPSRHQRLTNILLTQPPKPDGNNELANCPTILIHESNESSWTPALDKTTTSFFSIENILPANRESYFAYQSRLVASGMNRAGAYVGLWDVLFDPDVPVNLNARYVIAIALSSKQQEVHRLAIDAVISAVADGRIDGDAFGEVLGKLVLSENISPGRWATALREVSSISALHARFAHHAIEGCFQGMPLPEKGGQPNVPLLEVLHDLATGDAAIVLQPNTCTYLRSVTGKGKGAILAKLLLDMPQPDSANSLAALMQTIEIRLQRAERWQSWLDAKSEAPKQPMS